MPGLNGLEVAARIRHDYPATQVIIVSMHGDDESVRRALAAGAAGYILKNSDKSELELALRTVGRGDTWLSPSLTTRVVKAFTQGGQPSTEGPLQVLTPRQREVLQLVAEGHSNKEIATRLNVALKTVETHRTELMERLGIHGVAGLVRYAIRVGLVHPES
jgi:DNA-binding NarL/FixJ family response regulator